MRAARQPAQDVFGGEDGQRRCFHGPIDGGDEHQTAGAHHLGAGREEKFDIGNMLDHFHIEHDIESLAGLRQLLGGDGAIIDGNAGGFRMRRGDADVLFGGVGADDRGAHARHRLRQQSAAAADIEHAQALQRPCALRISPEILAGVVADVGQAHRIETCAAV